MEKTLPTDIKQWPLVSLSAYHRVMFIYLFILLLLFIYFLADLGACLKVALVQTSKSSQVKLSFIVIPLHVGTYSGTRCRASQDHGAT